MKTLLVLLSILIVQCKCNNLDDNQLTTEESKHKVYCTDNKCDGIYAGPEFINGSDIAHQLSNKISKSVGDKLKELYSNRIYSKVDFENIIMSTKGMGTGNVSYTLLIPLVRVKEKCDAYTSFDHVGGWNHKPALATRKSELTPLLKSGHNLYISKLKTTEEGLQEYWIQWKNKYNQHDC